MGNSKGRITVTFFSSEVVSELGHMVGLSCSLISRAKVLPIIGRASQLAIEGLKEAQTAAPVMAQSEFSDDAPSF